MWLRALILNSYVAQIPSKYIQLPILSKFSQEVLFLELYKISLNCLGKYLPILEAAQTNEPSQVKEGKCVTGFGKELYPGLIPLYNENHHT